MNCDEFSSLIDSMLDGELSVESTARANAHAKTCPTCGPERDRLATLHDRMTELVDGINLPEGLEKRIKVALADELKRNQKSTVFNFADYFKIPQMAVAAAILCLIAAGFYFSNSGRNFSGTKIAQTSGFNSISPGDLAFHTYLHRISRFKYSPEQLPALIKQTGFEIKPPTIVGWKLGDICICSIGKDGQPVAHMTYISDEVVPAGRTAKSQRKPKILTCYQVLSKQFNGAGMSEHREVAQKSIWSSEVNHLAIAFVKGHEVENIFVGAMPVRELVSIAGHS